jgi:hypothetical protein
MLLETEQNPRESAHILSVLFLLCTVPREKGFTALIKHRDENRGKVSMCLLKQHAMKTYGEWKLSNSSWNLNF